jgi:hypothetical protein
MEPENMINTEEETTGNNNLKETIKEIDTNFKREDLRIPITAISGKKNIKPETLLINLNHIIKENDTQNIDFTDGGTNNQELISYNNLFSDNIIFYCLIPQDEIDNSKEIQEYIKEKGIKNKEYVELTEEKEKERKVNKKAINDVVKKTFRKFYRKYTKMFR